MFEKYRILKMLYPEYLIMIRRKNKLYSFGIDKDMMEYFRYKKISHIIVDNFDLEINNLNNYELFYFKSCFIKILKNIKEEIKENA